MEELLAIQAATAMEEGLVSPAHLVVDTFPSEQGSQRVNDAATRSKAPKKVLQVITTITAECATQGTALQAQVAQLQHDLTQRMHRFGRQCRGMGNVCVTLGRQTETHLLELGQPVLTLAKAAQACLHGTPQLAEDQRVRLDTQLTAALKAHHRIAHQSRRLTQTKALSHGKIVNAYDPTMAPICKGKSNCPAPFAASPA